MKIEKEMMERICALVGKGRSGGGLVEIEISAGSDREHGPKTVKVALLEMAMRDRELLEDLITDAIRKSLTDLGRQMSAALKPLVAAAADELIEAVKVMPLPRKVVDA